MDLADALIQSLEDKSQPASTPPTAVPPAGRLPPAAAAAGHINAGVAPPRRGLLEAGVQLRPQRAGAAPTASGSNAVGQPAPVRPPPEAACEAPASPQPSHRRMVPLTFRKSMPRAHRHVLPGAARGGPSAAHTPMPASEEHREQPCEDPAPANGWVPPAPAVPPVPTGVPALAARAASADRQAVVSNGRSWSQLLSAADRQTSRTHATLPREGRSPAVCYGAERAVVAAPRQLPLLERHPSPTRCSGGAATSGRAEPRRQAAQRVSPVPGGPGQHPGTAFAQLPTVSHAQLPRTMTMRQVVEAAVSQP
jgi:hypothetical protein